MKLFFSAVLIFTSLFLKSQNPVSWGNLQVNEHGSQHLATVAEDAENIYVLKLDYGFKARKIWLLEGVDKNTKSIVFSKPLAEVHTSNAEETTFDNIFMLDTTLYLFSSLYKTSEQSLSAYATKINKRNGVFDETQLVYSTSVNKSEKAPEVSYNVSESGKHLLIGCSPFNSEKNSFKIITSTLAEASSTNLSETGNLKMSHYQALCDDSSNIFIYMYHVNKMDEENGYLLSYYAKTKISSFFKVTKPDEVYLYNSSMTITNNKLYFFSFFHSYKMFKGVMVGYERTKGLLSVLINKETNQVLNYNAHYFSRKELIELHGIRKNWEDTLGTYFIQEIIKNNSGDLFLIAEQKTHSHFKFFTYSAGYSGSSNPSEMAPLFYSGYLSILKINKEDAVINWVKLIPKNQMHAVPQYLSYSYTINNDALFFIYNDNNKNMTDSNPFGPATMNNQKTAVGRLAKLTFDGSLEIKNFYLPKANQKFALKPGVFGHSGSNKLLILADKNNQFKYSEIDVSTIK